MGYPIDIPMECHLQSRLSLYDQDASPEVQRTGGQHHPGSLLTAFHSWLCLQFPMISEGTSSHHPFLIGLFIRNYAFGVPPFMETFIGCPYCLVVQPTITPNADAARTRRRLDVEHLVAA